MPHTNQSRSVAIALGWSKTALFTLWVFACSAPAQPVPDAKATATSGVYNGTYAGEQGPIKFKLAVTQQDNGTLAGTFTLYLPDGADTKAYTCDIRGRYIPANRMVQVLRGKWETPPPGGVDMLGMNGVFDPGGAKGAGQISGRMRARPAPEFQAIRDPAESAKMVIAKKEAVPPASPGAQPARSPSDSKPAASPPSATVAAADVTSPTAINGVYTGTYQCVDGAVKAKFILKSTADGALTGLFTFDLPAWAGARPATYKLTGKYVAGNRWPFQFTTVEPLGAPAPEAYAMTGVFAAFRQGALVQGRNGMEYSLNPDHIFGSTPGKASVSFDATRDKTESADLDKVMDAQASAATAVRTTAPAAAPVARLHSIEGVYNGTFELSQGPPIKFKLIITQTGGGKLAGVATVYLPANSGEKAYTYSVDGVNDPAHHLFELYARDWNTAPPKDFEKTGFNGTFAADVAHNAARIFGPARFGPKFRATWDATESADIKLAIATQKGVKLPTTQELAAQAAAHAAAMKAHDETVKNAPPKQLASKDLVRKSKAYWDDYQNDMTREVFDGGFGADIDENLMFEELFCSYVDMFSGRCAANLPAKHETVTVTRYHGMKDGTGQWKSVPVESWTVEVDSRFAPKYREFVHSLGSSGQGLRTALAAMSSGLSPRELANEMMAPARDMDRFFADHPANSAAMRQLTENFLRGATKQPSLQQAGEKIEGAAAETDKDLPPGRFARFVDGANAFYRDPANAKYAGHNDTQFCQALAMRYQFKMTKEEEYYYANDFKARFFDQIMQPQDSGTDPEWPLLHPVVEECITKFR